MCASPGKRTESAAIAVKSYGLKTYGLVADAAVITITVVDAAALKDLSPIRRIVTETFSLRAPLDDEFQIGREVMGSRRCRV